MEGERWELFECVWYSKWPWLSWPWVRMLIWDELSSHHLRSHIPSVRIQLSFSHSSESSAVEVIQAPRLPLSTLTSLQQALEVSTDWAMGKVLVGRRAGRSAGNVPAGEPGLEHEVAQCLLTMPSVVQSHSGGRKNISFTKLSRFP